MFGAPSLDGYKFRCFLFPYILRIQEVFNSRTSDLAANPFFFPSVKEGDRWALPERTKFMALLFLRRGPLTE